VSNSHSKWTEITVLWVNKENGVRFRRLTFTDFALGDGPLHEFVNWVIADDEMRG
jgi:hypothetical protein